MFLGTIRVRTGDDCWPSTLVERVPVARLEGTSSDASVLASRTGSGLASRIGLAGIVAIDFPAGWPGAWICLCLASRRFGPIGNGGEPRLGLGGVNPLRGRDRSLRA